MPELGVVEAFDQISPVYDSTRSPIDPTTMDAIVRSLRARGISSVLEVGVGTGRIARPLLEHGLDVVGVDASAGMLARARAKGVPRLVRGNAYRLPFRDAAVDATIFVHVLHLLDDPVAAIGEACRVGRQGATALVRPPREGAEPDSGEGREGDPRRLVAEYLVAHGYPAPKGAGGPQKREGRILRACPPDHLEVVCDRMVTEPLAKRLDMIGGRASRHYLTVPPELLRAAVDAARAKVGDRTHTFRQYEALATWSKPPPLGALGPPGPVGPPPP